MGGKFPDTRLSTQIYFSTPPCNYREAHYWKNTLQFCMALHMQLTEFNILLTLVNFLSDYLSLQELSVLLI